MLGVIDRRAEELKSKIMTAKSAWNGAGTTYYVSNSGNDASDGTTPEAAWKTLERVNTFGGYKRGDWVLFERGGEWRGQLNAQGGVRYSAYGAGDKPIITGSDKNYAVASEWTETDVKNVWKNALVKTNDVGLVVFNHGEKWSYKMVVGIDGFEGRIDQMTDDLQMYHSLDDQHVYLYSDKGNPGARFDSIEMAEKRHVVTVEGDDVLIDNLFIRYGGSHGIGTMNRNGLTVKNCVLAWIGGSLQGVDPQARTRSTTRYGNAIEIYIACRDYTVENCYIYQIYDAAITHQFKNLNPETVRHENVLYKDNLIEKCTYSIEYFLDQENAPDQIMKNIEMTGNICRLAGCGFGDQRPDKTQASHIKSWDSHANRAENFRIHGNIFDRGRYMVMHCAAGCEEWMPEVYDNLFVQWEGGDFGRFGVTPNALRPFESALMNDERLTNNALCIVGKG